MKKTKIDYTTMSDIPTEPRFPWCAHKDGYTRRCYIDNKRCYLISKNSEYWLVEDLKEDTDREEAYGFALTPEKRNIAYMEGKVVDLGRCTRYDLGVFVVYKTEKGNWIAHSSHLGWQTETPTRVVGHFLDAKQLPPQELIDSVPEDKWL